MKRLLALVAALFLTAPLAAHAQTAAAAKTQTNCSTPFNTPVVGGVYPIGVNTSNQLCVYVAGGGGSGGTSSTFGAAFPSIGTAAGFQDQSGNMAAGLLDASGYLEVNVKAGAGGGYSVVNASSYANTGSFSNVPSGGLVTTAAPTYTTGQSSPLNLTTTGNLRVNDAAVVSALAGTLTVGLPSGAATAANQTNANQKTQIVDGSGNVIASTSNNLNVQCANCSGSGVSTADGATFTAGSSLFAGAGGIYQAATTSNPLTAGHQGLLQLNQYRGLYVNLMNSSGAEVGTAGTPLQVSIANTGANSTAVKVDGSAVTQPISGSLTNISGTISLPTGAATSALQTTGNASLSALAGAVDMAGTDLNVICTSGCSGGGGSGYSVLNASTYANNSSYSNVPSGGLVTTAAPTYTTGQASPLNLTTGGALRVDAAGVVTALGSPFQAGGSIGNTTFASTQSGTWNITNVSGTVSLPTGAATAAKQPALGTVGSPSADVISIQNTITNPTATFSRPANTTAYAAAQLVANSTTAGSVTPLSVTVGAQTNLSHLRLYTNKTSGMGAVNLQMECFSAAPTVTNGDGGTYAVATGSANGVGFATVSFTQEGDGAWGDAIFNNGPIAYKPASGTSLYCLLQTLTAFTPANGQTFTLLVETKN